jgi:hypothetical protein
MRMPVWRCIYILASISQSLRGMETNLSPQSREIFALNAQLNSASWEVGILIVPTTESKSEASDENTNATNTEAR